MTPSDNNNQWLVSADIFLTLSEFLSQQNISLPDSLIQQFELINNNSPGHCFIPAPLLGQAFQFAEKETNDPLIALRCGSFSITKHWGFLGYLIQTCQTTGKALATLDKYSKLISNQYTLSVHQKNDKAWIEATTTQGNLDQYSRHFIEYIIASILGFIARWTAIKGPCESFHFPWKAEASAEEYSTLLGAPCYFETEKLYIPLEKDMLHYKLQHHDPRLHQLMLEKTVELYHNAVMQDDWLIQLRTYIINNLSHGTPSLALVSTHLSMGERTLRRKLDKKGLTYQGLIDDVRKEISISLVQEAKLSLMEISLLLGFAEQSSFHRAFKRWTGKTPLQY